ncbi:ATP-dependent helicase [Peptoniphilaceae bacterium SGI.137]|nr:ATP-dependent helicase [Peptoniphilaceae bacterium]MDY3986673.1 ATP-dependent helicase [Peptoniphilaceae bacterium]
MEFTSSQMEAISHKNGPCLVLAVPGAGKTTVLLARIQSLLNAGIPANQIASITFSRQQARDMQARFFSVHDKKQGEPAFSTIHAFCFQILRHYAAQKNEMLSLIEGHPKWSKYQFLRERFAFYQNRAITEEETEDYFRIDGYLKNALMTYEQYRIKSGESFPHFQEISHDYIQFKESHNLIDFDDMLIRTLQILDQDPDLLNSLRRRFPFLQVDEAQDTSLIQWRIIQLLAAPENNLLMVADDDQSIYGFRGADPQYLLQFKKFYPDAKIILMQENYRSSSNIVEIASHFIVKNNDRYEKNITATQEGNDRVRILLVKSLSRQLQEIKKELAMQNKNETTAILFRNNLSAIAIAELFQQMNLHFSSNADPHKFFRNPILADILHILHFSVDPTDLRTFQKIYYKLGAYLKKIFLEKISVLDPYLPVLERLAELPDTQNRFYREKIGSLQASFSRLRFLSPKDAIDEILVRLGYGQYLQEHSRRQKKPLAQSYRTIETLRIIAEASADFPDLERHLKKLYDSLLHPSDISNVTLSTIHGAKGLEYDNVWLIDLIQEEFPSMSALENLRHGDADLLEEERRLFYVGITRAKKRLRLIGRTAIDGKKQDYSQFLDELTSGKIRRKRRK